MKRILTGLTIVLLLAINSASAGTPDFNRKVSFEFEKTPVSTVVALIAQQYGLNVVLSGQVTEEITVNLADVTLEDALKAILIANGYNYYLSGDIVIVKPIEMDAIGEIAIETVSLDYISPAAAINAASDLLTKKGKIKIITDPGGSGSGSARLTPTKIAVVDYPEVVSEIVAFIKSIDIREQQLSIQVRMIEVNVDSEEKYGLNWPNSISAIAGGLEESSSSTEESSSDGKYLGEIQLPDGKWQWGKLSVGELNVVLDFLEKKGNSKLISDPRITTLDNHEAEISITTIVPIQTINRFSEGGAVQDIVTFQDEEIGITLKVTPHITADNEILLNVHPTVAEITGYSGPIDNQKPITSERSLTTKIQVKDGETAVLGGLLKENKMETDERVFLLGSIPIIGNIFRHKSVQSNTTDLMILITPTILTD
jgi:type II secretory pathway component GspD/PulD (secretin)